MSSTAVGLEPERRLDLRAFAAQLDGWLAEEPPALRAARAPQPDYGLRVEAMAGLMAALSEAGWSRYGWPIVVGGLGGTMAHRAAMWEALARHAVPGMALFEHLEILAPTLVAHGPRPFVAEALPAFLAGRELWAQGFSEPDAGSDLAALRTVAVDDGDRFVVSGRKLWTSSADVADWIYLAVRTGPAERHAGLSVLVAPLDSPGIAVSAHATLGGGTIGEVVLEDVEVPREQLVGELNGGWAVLMGTLDHERVTSEKVGVVLWLLDALEPLAATPAERGRLLRLRGEAEAARLHGRRAAELLDQDRPASAQSSMAKLAVAVLMQRMAAAAVDLLGPAALLEQGTGTLTGRVAAFQRAAVATTISGGAAEVQRLVIARRGLA